MSVEAVPTPKKKTTLDIQTEFNNLAFRAGHLQRDIYLKEKELKMMNETLDGLYVEYATIKQQEDAVAQAIAESAPKVQDAGVSNGSAT